MKSVLRSIIFILITGFIVTSCKKEYDPPISGLVLNYPFNGNTNDASGNDNNGINYTEGNYVKGKRGLALDFNGTSNYIQLMNSINSENGLCFSFWIKSRGAAGTENNGVIIGKYNMITHLRSFLIYSFGGGDSSSTKTPQ